MRKQYIKTVTFISLLTFTAMASATNGGKTKPPEDAERESSTPTPTPTPTPSFWDWLKQYFVM